MTACLIAAEGIGRIGMGIRGSGLRVALGAAVLVLLLALPTAAFASDAPHVSKEDEPDACAMCHRAHTAPGVVARSQAGTWDAGGSALVIAEAPDPDDPSTFVGDQALCLTCHGIDGLGSTLDVQSDLLRESVHLMMPESSAYGPESKQCSSCHDAHGADKDPDTGLPFARLLRVFTEEGDIFPDPDTAHEPEEYCATCHFDARNEFDNRFDGLAIYEQTAHFAELPGPPSGTGVTCSICHAPHGSDIAPLIQPALYPDAVPELWSVDPESPRSLCFGCHEEPLVTYPGNGEEEFDHSIHGGSDVAVPVIAEWPGSEETTRLAGECQNCHNAMGTDDGEGEPIAKLVEAEGREVCYACHNEELAEETEGEIVDMQSAGVFPYEPDEEGAELVVAWDPENLPLSYSAVHVHTQERNVDPPRELEGPRRYLSGYRSGSIAYGDIDGDGVTTELVVADPSGPYVSVMWYDPLTGLDSSRFSVAESAEDTSSAVFVATGDFLANGSSGSDQIAVVSVDWAGESSVSVFEFSGGDFHDGSLSRIGPSVDVGEWASGLAAGRLGGSRDSLVVTSLTEDDTEPGEIRVLAESAPSELGIAEGPHTTGVAPRGPSVIGTDRIAYVNSGETDDNLVVIDADGDVVEEHTVSIAGDAQAWDTVAGDFLPGGESGVAVALRSETEENAVAFFGDDGSSLSAFGSPVETGEKYASSTLAVGDIDGDGIEQVVVANAGVFSRTPHESVSPSVQVFAIDGASMGVADPRWGGGVEMAGGTPGLAIVDLGPVGRSRHPASAIPGVHDSEEEGDFARHAECVDCHNPHTMSDAPMSAPDAYGVIAGAWGVDVQTNTLKQGVDTEYELCYKCHTVGWGETAPPSRDILAELDPAENVSVHPVMEDSPEGRIYCIDCHGNAGAADGEPAGPHVSTSAPLLREPFFAARPTVAEAQLCYETCHHTYDIYHDGAPGSDFYDATTGIQLHPRHVAEFGLACQTCHTNHGSEHEYLIRPDMNWVYAEEGGACFTSCHLGSTANAYSRSEEGDVAPTAVWADYGATTEGDVTDIQVEEPDGNYFIVDELQGTPAMRVFVEFEGVGPQTPVAFRMHGRYDPFGVAIGHTVLVQAKNQTNGTWETLGLLPTSSVDAQYNYPLADPVYVSGAGQVEIRIEHTSGGHQAHRLFIDRAWLSY